MWSSLPALSLHPNYFYLVRSPLQILFVLSGKWNKNDNLLSSSMWLPGARFPPKAVRTLCAGQDCVSWLPLQPPSCGTKQQAPLRRAPPAEWVPVSLSVSSGLPTPRSDKMVVRQGNGDICRPPHRCARRVALMAILEVTFH